MAIEQHPDSSATLGPSKDEDHEHSLGTAARTLVDDLFTHQVIGEMSVHQVQANNALAILVKDWKQDLVKRQNLFISRAEGHSLQPLV